MTVHVHHGADEVDTYEDLIQVWKSVDEPLSQAELDELWHRRTPRTLVVARCLYVVIVLTTLVCLPTAARAVGHALQ